MSIKFSIIIPAYNAEPYIHELLECLDKQMTDEEADYCYECGGYGDDYYTDDNGDLVCRCSECPFNPFKEEDEE